MRCVSLLSAATVSGATSLFCSTTSACNMLRSCVASADSPSSRLKVSSSAATRGARSAIIGIEFSRLTAFPTVLTASRTGASTCCICAMRGARLVSRRSFSALSTGLFACACSPPTLMVSEACRTSVRLVAMRSSTRLTPASTTPTPTSMRPNPFSTTSVALRLTNHAPKVPSRLRPRNTTASAMAIMRIVFSSTGILDSDVLFRSKHG